jgi:hypothetical protein
MLLIVPTLLTTHIRRSLNLINRLFSSAPSITRQIEVKPPTAKIDYASLGSSRKELPPWIPAQPINVTTSLNPHWRYGQGTSSTNQSHVEIDPFEPGRPRFYNYALLISSIAPRPIGLVSTISANSTWHLSAISKSSIMTLLSLSSDSLVVREDQRIHCKISKIPESVLSTLFLKI